MSRTRFQEVTAMPAPSAHIRFRERTGSLRAALMLLVLLAASAATAPAQTFKTLYNFCGKKNPAGFCADGGGPFAPLVQGANGDLYGTTIVGGTNDYGTVFKVTTAGKLKLTTIYNFCSQPSCTDGWYPIGGLVLATDGNFYGTTTSRGAYGDYGTVFKITAAGKLTTLHSFNGTDGWGPQTGLVQATNGNFYGTTYQGGTYNYGTAFEITSSGTLTWVYSFCAVASCPDGAHPNGLIQAADGNFYGTTLSGVGNNVCSGYGAAGTFFQITPSGTLTTLALFCPLYQNNGISPDSALVQAANGNFYGTTEFSIDANGTGNGKGTVYEMTPTGSATWLYNFCLQPGCPDGNAPITLMLGTDGNFYGTTFGSINGGDGTVFEITPTGQLTTLHSFSGTDGQIVYDNGPLLLDTNGTFYGITFGGGEYYNGTIYSINTGLGAFVETIPTSGAAKTKVTILGTNLKGATAVSFNGTAATFKVVGSSEIKTTVPAGATSGTVTVTTSGGTTLNSNVAFQVP